MLEVGNGGACSCDELSALRHASRTGMSTSEYEAHFTLWAMLKSPLLQQAKMLSEQIKRHDCLAEQSRGATIRGDPGNVMHQGEIVLYSQFVETLIGGRHPASSSCLAT